MRAGNRILSIGGIQVHRTPVWLIPGSCDLSRMSDSTRIGLECSTIGGQPAVAVAAAFGGWAMYRAELFRWRGGRLEDGQGSVGRNGMAGDGIDLLAPRVEEEVGLGDRNGSGARGGCRHDLPQPQEAAVGGLGGGSGWMLPHHYPRTSQECEHVSLSLCIVERYKAVQVIATDLVVNWGGCEAAGTNAASKGRGGRGLGRHKRPWTLL